METKDRDGAENSKHYYQAVTWWQTTCSGYDDALMARSSRLSSSPSLVPNSPGKLPTSTSCALGAHASPQGGPHSNVHASVRLCLRSATASMGLWYVTCATLWACRAVAELNTTTNCPWHTEALSRRRDSTLMSSTTKSPSRAASVYMLPGIGSLGQAPLDCAAQVCSSQPQ